MFYVQTLWSGSPPKGILSGDIGPHLNLLKSGCEAAMEP
jgi:hypothetical protein